MQRLNNYIPDHAVSGQTKMTKPIGQAIIFESPIDSISTIFNTLIESYMNSWEPTKHY